MFEILSALPMTDLGKIVIPALIGALTAIIIVVVKDYILYELRESKKEKRALIDTKLSKIYGPLYTVIVSAEQTLPTFFTDGLNYSLFVSHQHLLSPKLQEMVDECLSLNDGTFTNPTAKVDDMKRMLEISANFRIQLKKEMNELRKNYR